MDIISLRKFKEKGYCIVSIEPCFSLLKDMRSNIFKINNCISEKKDLE